MIISQGPISREVRIAEMPPKAGEVVDVRRIADELLKHNRFLVTSHARPDGDAVGSTLALGCILQSLGKKVDMVLADPVPNVYRSLPGFSSIRQVSEINPDDYDMAVILECDCTLRTGVRGMDGMTIMNVDHHRTGLNYGRFNWIDPDASAVATMVFEIALAVKAEVTPGIATCLYTSLMTDTGSFTYPGTSAETFTLAHALIDLGARADSVARDVLYSVPIARIHLLGIALSRLKVNGSVAWTWLMQEDLERHGATEEDAEGAVNYLISIENVHAAAFLREVAGGPLRFRTSLRSKSDLDVSLVATKFNGGGHRNAAGCTVDGPFPSAVERILHAMWDEMDRTELPLPGQSASHAVGQL